MGYKGLANDEIVNCAKKTVKSTFWKEFKFGLHSSLKDNGGQLKSPGGFPFFAM